MTAADRTYNSLVAKILSRGVRKESRAGATIGIFGHQMVFDLRDGFPLLTTKKMVLSNVYHELMWFLRGDTNINTLKAPQLWKDWAKEDGSLGPVYGKQWVDWGGYDLMWDRHEGINQVQVLIDTLKNDPSNRRMIVSAWNVAEIKYMRLPPCHLMYQCYVEESNGQRFLDLQMYQRSCDTAIGVPYNIASYALLLMMLAKEVNMTPRYFIHSLGDAHIYANHVEKIKEQMKRESASTSPTLVLNDLDFWARAKSDSPSDYELINYTHGPHVKYEIAV